MTAPRRGYSVVEMLVVLLILGLLVPGLATALEKGLTMLSRTRSALTAPQLNTACLQLRADLESAAEVGPGGGGWTRGPLVLELPGGDTIRYEVRAGALLRTARGARAPEEARTSARTRVVARPATALIWSQPGPRLIAVEITAPVPVELAGGRTRPASTTLVCALRGAVREVPSW